MHESKRGNGKYLKYVSLLLCMGMVLALRGAALASGGEGGHEGGLNWTDFLLRLGNFVILLFILVKLLKKPIAGFFSKRREDIQTMLAELEIKKKEAEQKTAEYKSKLASLEDETRKIVSELIAEGEDERKKIVESGQKQAEYMKQQAQLAIQQEIKVARESLQEEISELSVAAAEQILRKKMKTEDQERLVREFTTRVVEAK